jgi:hypothetical protein
MAGRSSVLGAARFGFAESIGAGAGGSPALQLPPVIVTNDPEDVTECTATFVATLTTNERPCMVYFRYFQGANSLATGQVAVDAASQDVRVAIPIAGLTPNTLSSCRAWAFQTTGPFAQSPVHGDSVPFTTLPVSGFTIPTVNNHAATNITPTTARLHASVNPNNSDTTVTLYVRDAIDNLYLTAPVNIGAGTAFVDVDADVSGLPPNFPMAAECKATNAAGTVLGEPLGFSTPPLSSGTIPTLISSITSTIGATSADVQVDFDTGGIPCSVVIEWGLTTAYGAFQTIPVTAVQTTLTATLAPLLATNTYHWIARISNAQGSVDGGDQTFDTATIGVAPTGRVLLPTRIRDQSARLNCEFNPNGTATNVVFGYALTQGDLLSQTGSYIEKAAVPINQGGSAMTAFAANIPGLSVGTLYYYRPQAGNSGGQTFGGVGVFQTADANMTANPALILAEFATDIETTSVTFSANVNTRGESTSWCVEYWITGQPVQQTPIQIIIKSLGELPGLEIIAIPVAGLISNQAYNYRFAMSSANDEAIQFGATQTFTTDAVPTNPPATGSINTTTGISSNTASFSGTVTDSTTAGTAAFEYSLLPDFSSGVTTTSPAFTIPAGSVNLPIPIKPVSNLLANKTYYVRVVFINNAGANTSHSTSGGSLNNGVDSFDTTGPQLPNVSTLPNPDVSDHTATLELTLTKIVASGDHFAKFGYSLAASPTVPPNYDFFTPENAFGSVPGTVGWSFTIGQGGSNPPLSAATNYRFMAFARNDAGSVHGVEQTFTTDPTPVGVFPDPEPSAPYNITATSFYVAAKVLLNGVVADVNFEWYNTHPSSGHTPWSQSTPAQTIVPNVDSEGDERTVSEQVHFVPNNMVSGTFGDLIAWRVNAVNANGTAGPVVGTQIQLGIIGPQAPPISQIATMTTVHCPQVQALTTMMKDDTRAVIRTKVWHKGLRHWGQFEYTTDADWQANGWVNSIKGPIESCESHTQIASNGTIPNTRWFHAITGLTPNTDYVWRFRVWNVNGEWTPINSPTGIFKTDQAASWPGTIGSKSPRGNVNWEIKSDFRNAASPSISEAQEIVWGADEYVVGGSEKSFTLIVTPTLITADSHATHGTTSWTVNDGAGGGVPGLRAMVKALQLATIGDIIRVDSSQMHLYQLAKIGSGPNANDTASWGGPNQFRPITGVRIQPLSKAAGNFRWQGSSMNAGGGGFNGIAVRYCDVVRWSGDLANWYMSSNTDYSIWPADAGGPGYGLLAFYDCTFGVGDGILGTVTPPSPYTGIQTSNPDYQGYGVRTHLRANSPLHYDVRRCFFSQGQEHSLYLNSPGAFNGRTTFIMDCEVITAAIGARPGVARIPAGPNGGGVRPHIMTPQPGFPNWGWGSIINYHEGQLASRNTFLQVVERADEVIAGATGPGSPPGRGAIVVRRCIFRCRPN